MKLLRPCLIILASWLTLGWCGPATAVLSSPQVLPPQANVAVNRSARISINWRLTTDTGPVVESPAGVLDDGSRVYLNVDRALSVPATRAGSDPATGQVVLQTVTLRETLTVPAAVLSRAKEQGVARFNYTRLFKDANSTLGMTLVLHITGSSGAGFSINYLGLQFPDGAVRRMVERNETLHAQAKLRFSGSGQIQGVWEIADPSSTAGEPVFRTLRVVRDNLFGVTPHTLSSPDLPTRRPGLYLLRLRVIHPRLDMDMPVLQYYVLSPAAAQEQRIELLAPADNATLQAGTVFRWQPLGGASAYRLEIYPPSDETSDMTDGADGRPLTGMLVGAPRNLLALSPLARRHMAPGGRYRWRLIAIDADGHIIGRSGLRRLHVEPGPRPTP